LTQEEIFEYSPEAESGIKKGDILKIPIKSQKNLVAEDEYFIYHHVKSGETINSLAAKYNISESQIKLVNPSIDGELNIGQVINIPKKELTESEFLLLQGDASLIPNLLDIDPLYFEDPSCEPCSEFVYKNNKVFKIAYLLPLFIDDNYIKSFDLLSDPDDESFYSITEKFYEFYEGSLIAINDLREKGLSVEIFVYDTEKDSILISNILSKPELKQMDLIIGPLYSENIAQVAEFGKVNKINIVSPISQKNEVLSNNPFVFQVVPSKNMIVSKEAAHFTNYLDSNIIVIHNGTVDETTLVEVFKQKLANTLALETDTEKVYFKEVNFVTSGLAGVKAAMKKDMNNIVIIFSVDEIFLGKILNALYAITIEDKKSITLYGMAAWELSENMKIEHLQNLKIHYPTSSFVDYSDWRIKRFIGLYRNIYNSEPTAYSFQGYDISYYFLSALKRYGKFFQFCLSPTDLEPNRYGIFLEFEFQRLNGFSGFENNGAFILQYDENINLRKIEN
jgi:LysM repeat protein/ABC-type branched-subunit amino acid transport system substrate-binding protein